MLYAEIYAVILKQNIEVTSSTCYLYGNFLSHDSCDRAYIYAAAEIWLFFDFSRWQPPPSWILEISNFSGWDAQEGRTASACQILAKSLKMRLRYNDFSIFQDGGRPPSWIFKSWKFQLPFPFGGPICVTVPNFAKIGQTVKEIWPIFDFSRWRPPPSWILEISNF